MACSGDKGQDVCQAGVQGLLGRGLDKAGSTDSAGFTAKATSGKDRAYLKSICCSALSR